MRTFKISVNVTDNDGNGSGYENGNSPLTKEQAIDTLLDVIAFIRYNPNEEPIECDESKYY